MGRLTRLLAFIRTARSGVKLSDSQISDGTDANVTAEHFAPAGDDAHPLPGDYVIVVSDAGTGREAAVGYLDPLIDQVAQPGEKRIYSRTASGATVSQVHLQSDGGILISNTNGSISLQSDGTVSINGVTIAPNGDMSVSSSLVLDGKELADHTHGGVESGGSNTGVNN